MHDVMERAVIWTLLGDSGGNTAAAQRSRDDHPHPYRPILGLPYWDVIGPFIDAAVADMAQSVRESPGLYSAITPFVLWCWQARGMELRRDRVFPRALIDQFIHLATPGLSLASKATHRSALWRMVETLNPLDTSVAGVTLPRSAPLLPYSRPEVAQLRSWAAGQSTPRRRADAAVLLALGFGAGLATREILEVTTSDIISRGDDLFISVWASRPRVVPVLSIWQESLRARAEESRGQIWAFCPGRQNATTNQVTNFLTRSRTNLDIRPTRMRATWIRDHLATGTSPIELLQMSGIKNLAALQNSLTLAAGARLRASKDD